MQKLIIWDFDGVIADSEKLWVQVWRDTLKKEKNIILSPEEELKLLFGMADSTRKEHLEKYFPNLCLDGNFMQKISDGEVYMGMNYMQAVPDVETVMADKRFAHCIATGATKNQHAWKMTQFQWILKYMSEQDFFTVDMVARGKPEPDLFLLASKTKGFSPTDCIVIGDSLSDFVAANAAGIDAIAFVGCSGNNNPEYIAECRKAGVKFISATMPEIHKYLENIF